MLEDFYVDSELSDSKLTLESIKGKKKELKKHFRYKIIDYQKRIEEAIQINNDLEEKYNDVTIENYQLKTEMKNLTNAFEKKLSLIEENESENQRANTAKQLSLDREINELNKTEFKKISFMLNQIVCTHIQILNSRFVKIFL